MDPLRLSLALGPLTIYLTVLAAVNAMGRPWVVSGARDMAALGIAIGGLVMVGPMELFFPYAAASQFGPGVWGLLIGLYLLGLTLLTLIVRSRIVIYNCDAAQLRSVLAEVARELDPSATLLGDTMTLPQFATQMTIETHARWRNVSLVALGHHPRAEVWRQLESSLAVRLQSISTANRAAAWRLAAVSALMAAILVLAVAGNPQGIADGVFDLLQIARPAQPLPGPWNAK